MTILLIELETKGHHVSSYLRSIVLDLINKKKKIILLTSRDIKKNAYFSFFEKHTKLIFINKINYPKKNNFFSLIAFQFNNYKIIKKKYDQLRKNEKINHIYINTLDFLDKPLSILGSPFGKTKFSGLYLNPKFYIKYNILFTNLIKSKLYLFLFRKILKINELSNIFMVDPLCVRFLNRTKSYNHKKIIAINDLGSSNKIKNLKLTKSECRKILKISNNNFIILVYGYIRKNKSLDELLNVINHLKTVKPVKILIVGKRDEYIKKYLKRAIHNDRKLASKIIDINRYSDDMFEKIVFKASDLTWTGYTKDFYGSSGVYFLSSINFRPVISSNHGAIGWYSRKYKIGYSIDLTNKKKLINLLNKIINFNKRINYDFNQVNSRHNFKNFGSNICINFK
tara:strand:- start:119 stop:1309 length:1191 start_codon:yes stop_codon:yes gene_type:complete